MSLMTSTHQKRQHISNPKLVGRTRSHVREFELSLVDKIMMALAVLICLGCGWGIVQANQATMMAESAIVQQVQESNRIKEQTQQILNSIADQFNYEMIKEAARQEGMTVNEDRVRSVK